MQQSRIMNLAGWGNFPTEACQVFAPRKVGAIRALVRGTEVSSFIPRGLGRSYGDSSLNGAGGVLLQTRRSHFLAFDETTGVLECEAGVSIADIVEHLLPRGWFLATTPGTKFVTLGGAVAADVHGKNHHVDGSFSRSVLGFLLLTADGNVVDCTPERAPELFWATVGGMGLTGVILNVRLQLRRVESACVRMTCRRTANLDETLECFSATAADYRYSVAWIDCLAMGVALGRSVVMLANDATVSDLTPPQRHQPCAVPRRAGRRVPGWLPGGLINPWTVRAFNAAYYAAHPDGERLVDYESFFYPLDAVLQWNRVYGSRGFIQYQAMFPPATSRPGLVELLEEAAGSQQSSFLAVLKASGPASGGRLSFLSEGHTLAMDFPNTGPGLRALVARLDRIVVRHGGRLYLAKDALLPAAIFAEMYPALGEFRKFKSRIDPAHRFSSSQARRLGIVESW
jgi:decaprenylphospho-beta-D-ribofuranose 2-oxidase